MKDGVALKDYFKSSESRATTFPEVVSLGEPMLEFNAPVVGLLKDIAVFERGWGGDTSNFAIAVSRMGRKVGYVCRIGDDEFGKCFLEIWEREGVDTSHVTIERGSFTGIYFISVKDGGEHDFTYYRSNSAASHLSPEDIDPKYIERARVFHSSGISQAISQSCREAVFKAAEVAKRSGVLFSYDPNIRLKLWPLNTAQAIINYTIELADVVLPSLEDARLFTGEKIPESMASYILKRGAKVVGLKLGSNGCLIATDEQIIKLPGFKVTPVDTTGAGDAFDAAFIVGVLEGWEMRKIAEFANAAGALTTMGRGAVTPLPTRKKVEEFLSSMGKSS